MTASFILPPLPAPSSNPYVEIEELLVQLRTTIEDRYNRRVVALIVTTSAEDEARNMKVLRYAVQLLFINRTQTEHRLLELTCSDTATGFPVEVTVSVPPQPVGQATNLAELGELIQQALSHPATRMIINTYYKL